MIFSQRYRVIAYLLINMILCSLCALDVDWAASLPEKQVLFISAYTPDNSTDVIKTERFKQTLSEKTRYEIQYAYEYLDLAKFSNTPDYGLTVQTYLKQKYGSVKPDLIVSDASCYEKIQTVLGGEFKSIPVVLDWNTDLYALGDLPANITALSYTFHLEKNMDLIQKVHPSVRTIYLVLGDTVSDHQRINAQLENLKGYADQLNIVLFDQRSESQVVETVGNARSDSAVLYVQWPSVSGGNGLLDTLCKVSSVPVYSINAQAIGSGALGGYVTDMALLGEKEALQAKVLLETGKLQGPQVDLTETESYLFDHSIMKRWGVSEQRLPEGSVILNKDKGILYAYQMYAIIGLLICVVQLLIILFLLSKRRKRKDMERKLVESNASLQTLTEKLLSIDRAKDAFLANTSHELQTPLNGLINISESLLSGTFGAITPDQRSELSVILAVSKRLSSLVKDLVDIERINQNELELKMGLVDLEAVIETVVDTFKHLNAITDVEISIRIDKQLPMVYADESRLWQVLFNVIGNALKFTNGGVISIRGTHEGERVKLFVEDTGIGIPIALHETIFDAYVQGEKKSSNSFGGTGLGLFISRQLMQRMSGDLQLEKSTPNIGSVFSIGLKASNVLPTRVEVSEVNEAEVENNPAPIVDESKLKKHIVLVVDDEPTNLRVVETLLNGRNYSVITAMSGNEALEILRTRRDIELVLLDVMMPGISGYETCKRIRKFHTLYDLPVLLLTVLNTPDDIARGFESGANDFINKPIVAKELLARIETHLMIKVSVKMAVKNEMAFFQAQIKPHFLFNAMSTIMSFCYTDAIRAGELLGDLSTFLHKSYSIDNTAETTTLENELELTQAYTQIELARFGERLKVSYEIDDRLLTHSILPLTIQPLVENAIRHGLMTRKSGGTVKINVAKFDNGYCVSVEDDGGGIHNLKPDWHAESEAKLPTGGIGLGNIRWRLKNYYGTELELFTRLNEGTTVRFFVPEKE